MISRPAAIAVQEAIYKMDVDMLQKTLEEVIMNRFSEKDWKLFRNKIVGWQEAYMDKLNKEYMAILSGEGDASERFWKLEKRIREDKKDCGVQCEMSRSNQFYIMLELLNKGAITIDDLEEFSDDLKETMKHFFNR